METNDNQKYIYIRSTRERVPVTEEEFDNYYISEYLNKLLEEES